MPLIMVGNWGVTYEVTPRAGAPYSFVVVDRANGWAATGSSSARRWSRWSPRSRPCWSSCCWRGRCWAP